MCVCVKNVDEYLSKKKKTYGMGIHGTDVVRHSHTAEEKYSQDVLPGLGRA